MGAHEVSQRAAGVGPTVLPAPLAARLRCSVLLESIELSV